MAEFQGFHVSFAFPVDFTAGTFEVVNRTLVDRIARLELDRRHRLLVVIDDAVHAAHPHLIDQIRRYVDAYQTTLVLAAPPMVVPGGEVAKQGMDAALQIVSAINDYGLDRQAFVVVIGGGAVLDMVSFAAAIAHRGVRVVRLPTTTLSQGDSGIAVKNGVNYFGKKNFIGTFVPPFAVINDSDFLKTLSPRDRRSGLSEAVKVAVLRDPVFFEWLAANAVRLNDGDPSLLSHAVRRCAELHLQHICGNGDPFELSSARPLDFGHWAAHKLEALTNHGLRHGEAVAIGIALDTSYSARSGFLDRRDAEKILRVLETLGFTLFDAALLAQGPTGRLRVLDGLREFREHLGGDLHVTLLRGIGRAFDAPDMDADLVRLAIDDLLERIQAPRSTSAPSRA